MKRSFSVIVISIALSIVGCALLPLLPVKLAPSQTLPSITVSYSMQGASARTVEQEVTSRIESVLARVAGVKSIDSKSSKGGGYVSVGLDRHADMENARFEISTLVRQIWDDFPEGVSYPDISLSEVDKEGSRPFITLALNAPSNPAEILSYGEKHLKPILSGVRGVGKVELSGAQPMEWKLHYDMSQLSSLGITPNDIRNAISEHYHSEFLGIAPVGKDGNHNDKEEWMRLSLKSVGATDRFMPHEIVLTTKDGGAITLDKIVTVSHVESDPAGYFRINGLNSIYVNITSENDANQLKVSENIKKELESFAKTMPAGFIVDSVYDASEEIHEELNKIYFRTGLTVLILLIFVALVSFSIRYVLLITMGLTINLAVAVVFYYLMKLEIQMYSLAGITISLNLIIDNLIVMADHYTRRRNLGAFTSILAATLTTVGALSVVFFMDEKTRLSLQDFVTVVIINLTVSLAVALFLVPALVDRLNIKRDGNGGRLIHMRRRFSLFLSKIYEKIVGFVVRFRVVFIILAIVGFGLPVFMIPETIESEGWFAERYNTIFGSSTYIDKVKPWVDNILGGTLRLFVEKVYEGSYWKKDHTEPVLGINTTLPNGATLEQMNSLVKDMEKYLGEFPEIRQFQTSISGPRRATISVFFEKDHQHDGFPYRLKNAVISKTLNLGGGNWSVYGLDDTDFTNSVSEMAGMLWVSLTGYNYDDLFNWAKLTRDTLLSHKRIREVTISSEISFFKDDYTEFYLSIDPGRLSMTGVTAARLFKALEPVSGRGTSVGRVPSEKGNEEIRIYSEQGEEYDIFALMNNPVMVDDKIFKLSDVASVDRRQTPKHIVKNDQEYVIFLQYEYIGALGQGMEILEQDLEKINAMMPLGYKAEADSILGNQKDKDSPKYWLLLLVAAIIFVISSILFNSLRQPLAIIFIIPVSFIGVFLIFYLLKLKFDQGGFASFILLAGITVNAAIYILNEYNTLRRQYLHVSARKLYIKAFRIKIVPIMLTVLSTILGFIPFIVGESKESFWYPLAIGTMGGLAMSLLALLIIFPIFVLPNKGRCKTYR